MRLASRTSLILVAAAALQAWAESCCPECGESCPWNGVCDDGRNFGCMDKISGPFKCRDESVCINYAECDDEQAALRSGHLCNHFPWYNGGFPMDPIKWNSEVKSFACKEPSASGTYCEKWDTLPSDKEELRTGTLSCTTPSANGQYCQVWNTVTSTYEKCWTEFTSIDEEHHNEIACCDGDNANLYSCCSSNCNGSQYNAYPPLVKHLDCECLAAAENERYCRKWSCNEYEYHGQTREEGAATGHFECRMEDSSGSYCREWDGKEQSVEEFAVSTCHCTASSSTSAEAYCASWTCMEKGVDYYWPNTLWAFLPGFFGFLPLLIFVGSILSNRDAWNSPSTLRKVYVPLFWAALLIWHGGFCVIGIWKAGLSVLFLVFLPGLALTLAGTLYACCAVPQENEPVLAEISTKMFANSRSERVATASTFSISYTVAEVVDSEL